MAKKKQKEVQVIENPIVSLENANIKRIEVIHQMEELRARVEKMAVRLEKTSLKEYGTNQKRKDEQLLKTYGKILEINNTIISACNNIVKDNSDVLQMVYTEMLAMKKQLDELDLNE